ncbi:hypothetical protein DL95DRAFT_435594 [Leptodontidium sp. 2 PMI_412]|nr:hypothetical protein DL95DRAFT_435594 [Leptodontidium sp. 2 PMI_412]
MQRRSHKKSRKGCLGCKRRHIKCDESRPSCLNCVTVGLSCGYHNISPAATPTSTPGSDRGTVSSDSPSSALHSAAGSSILEHFSAAAAKDEVSYQAPIQTGINLIHLELLNNMVSVTCKDFRRDENAAREHVQIGIKYGLKTPYLMHEILAVSALHLSTLRPHQQEFYRDEATELQTCALSLFNNSPVGHTFENLPSVVLFSSFLGIHVLFDTLLFRPADFSLFIGRFIRYLRLHRGVFTIVKGSWSRLQETDLQPLLGAGRQLGQVEAKSGTECDALKSLMQSADLSQGSIEACQQALKCLQWVFDALRVGDTEGSGEVDLILAWPIMISPEFTDLLSQCRPEALVILAYYAVVLHYRRDLWIINDGGRFLIESITRYLGSYWQQWLTLPTSVLSEADSIN